MFGGRFTSPLPPSCWTTFRPDAKKTRKNTYVSQKYAFCTYPEGVSDSPGQLQMSFETKGMVIFLKLSQKHCALPWTFIF